MNVQDEVATRIWDAFHRERIEIPYPTRTVYVRQQDAAKPLSSTDSGLK